MSFQVALQNVLLTIFYIAPGYLIGRFKKASPEHLSTLSGVLVYILSPCMTLSSFLALDYSRENLINMGLFFIVTLILQAAFMGILYGIFHKKYEDSRYRILNIGAVLGNVGFFGLPIVKALLPGNPEVMCYAVIYGISMNILVFTMGVYCLTKKKEFMTVRAAIINPATISVAVALPLFIAGGRNFIPPIIKDSIDLLGRATTPMCMIILGVRLSTISWKKLFGRPFVYGICLAKLLAFPLFAYAMVYFLPLPFAFKASVLVLSATPCASYILNMAEIHRSETELSANCVLVSTLLCFMTIPLMTLLL